MERYTKGILQEANVTEKVYLSNQMRNKCTLAKISMIVVTATIQCTIHILKIDGLVTFTKIINKDMEKLPLITEYSGKEISAQVHFKEKL